MKSLPFSGTTRTGKTSSQARGPPAKKFCVFGTHLDFFQGCLFLGPISTPWKLWSEMRTLWSKIVRNVFINRSYNFILNLSQSEEH